MKEHKLSRGYNCTLDSEMILMARKYTFWLIILPSKYVETFSHTHEL